MKHSILSAIAAVLFLAVQPLTAQTAWDIDASHSSVQFRVKHLMISNVRGTFDIISGNIQFDGENYESVKAEAVIQSASINTREPKRDEHLRSADFFDTATYPTITFVSKSVEDVRGNLFKLIGDLTMRGTTKEVVLDVEATPVVKGMRGESRIGVHATTRLDRQDYGIKWNRALDAGGFVVGNEIDITLDLELVKNP
ncbi:MAG: YceI family protein [Acidobacteria bacterium]|nr:YceI family protein [Acidobacteriota bacterium]